jgi:hypothetical protein
MWSRGTLHGGGRSPKGHTQETDPADLLCHASPLSNSIWRLHTQPTTPFGRPEGGRDILFWIVPNSAFVAL